MISFRAVFLVFGCLIAGLAPGCQPRHETNVQPQPQDVVMHTGLSEDVSIKEAPAQMRGQNTGGIGYVRPEDKDSSPIGRPQNDEFRLKQGEEFSAYMIVLNCWNDTRTFMISILLDYEQTRFPLDGKDALLHKIAVPGNTEVDMPLKLSVEESGAHDLIGVLFEDPDNVTLDNSFRLDLYGHANARRTQIIVGDNQEPAGEAVPLTTGVSIPSDAKFRARLYFASSETGDGLDVSQRQLYTDNAVAGGTYEFEMVCNNVEDRAATYAMVPFLNFRQVDVSGQDRFFAYLGPNEEAAIHQRLSLPEQPGVNQFQVVWLFDPYKSVLQHEVLAPFVLGSPRIAIDTR